MVSDVYQEVLSTWPYLYHVAHRDAFDSILRRGLLSTKKLLDIVGADDFTKQRLVFNHRPENVVIPDPAFGSVVVRDQKPMSREGLERALPPDVSPEEWFGLLNERVFFWLTEARLSTFLNARAYRDKEHLVLTLDTKRVLDAHIDFIDLSPINSGATKPMPHPRDRSTFTHISKYPWESWRRKRARRDVAAEFCVRGGVAGIRECLIDASIRQGDSVVRELTWRE